jgi:tetratricopeptide (TPR) repeat protein
MDKYNLILLITCVCVNLSLAGETNNPSPGAHIEGTNSHSARNYLFDGMTNIQKQEWDTAISNFKKCLLLDSNELSAYYGSGVAFFEEGDLVDAIISFTRIIQHAPQESVAYLNRGNIYLVQQRYDAAIADFDKCLQLSPTNDLAYKCRASAYGFKMDYQQAIKDYTSGLNLNVNDSRALASRANLYLKTYQFDKAINDFQNAIKADTNNYSAYNDYAMVLATCPINAARDGNKAIINAIKACDLTGWRKWECLDTLAMAFAENGDFKSATYYEKKAIGIKRMFDSNVFEMNSRILLYESRETNHESN